MHYSWNKNDLNAQTHGWSKILLESFKLTKRFLTSEPKLDKRSKRTRSHTPTTVGDILTFVLQTQCINSLIESPSPSNRRRFFSTLHSLLRFSCFVLINFLLGLPRHTQIDSVIWWRCLIWFAVINLPRAPRHSEACVFVAALMRACARPDSGVHEINHFCQSLPLTLIKSMPLYRRQLRRRLWQRGVLSRTKCHGVHYLLQEAWGEKCDAAPVSKKRSAVCGPLRSESVCEVDISLNPYQWHIFQAVTPWPCLVSLSVFLTASLCGRRFRSDFCDVWLCFYGECVRETAFLDLPEVRNPGTRRNVDRHMRREREKQPDENECNLNALLYFIKYFTALPLTLVPRGGAVHHSRSIVVW